MKPRPTHEKRRKEQQRQERQKEKAEKRAQRKAAKTLNPDEEGLEGEVLVMVEHGQEAACG